MIRAKLFVFALMLHFMGQFIPVAYGYELATHGGVTYNAYQRSVLKDDQFLKDLGIDTRTNLNPDEPFGVIYYDISENTVNERQRHSFEGGIIQELATKQNFDVKPLSLAGWLLRGAIREDDWQGMDAPGCRLQAPNPNDEQLDRPGNHFYDPVHDRPLSVGAPLGRKAPDWALGTADFLASPPPPDAARANHYTVPDAREALYRALTLRRADGQDIPVPAPLSGEAVRQAYWATAFRALGNVAHLVQDMAQPQHTRNDPHLGCYTVVAGKSSVYEQYIESRAIGVTYTTPGGQTVQAAALDYLGASPAFPNGYPIPSFTDYASFFTTRHKDSGVPARQGMADYSNRGFFSAGKSLTTNDPEYEYPPNDYFAYGRQTADTNWAGEPLGGRVTLLTHAVPDALTGQSDPEVPLLTAGAWDEFLEARSFPPRYTLNRHNYDAMAALLIPRAVAYSAGLLNYFFRGRMEITPPAAGFYGLLDHAAFAPGGAHYPTDVNAGFSGFDKIKLTLKNTTPPITPTGGSEVKQDMPNGTLRAVVKFHRNLCYDDLLTNWPPTPEQAKACRSEREEIVTSAPAVDANGAEVHAVLHADDAPNGIELTFTFSDKQVPINAWDVVLQVVYRGQLGTEADAVVVATKDISEPMFINLMNTTDYVLLNGTFYPAADFATAHQDLFAQVYTGCRQGLPGSYTLAPSCYNKQDGFTFTAGSSTVRIGTGGTPVPPRRLARLALLGDHAQPGGLSWQLSEITCPMGFLPNPWVPQPYAAQRNVQGDTATFMYDPPGLVRGVTSWSPLICVADIGSTATAMEDMHFEQLDALQAPTETAPVPLTITGW